MYVYVYNTVYIWVMSINPITRKVVTLIGTVKTKMSLSDKSIKKTSLNVFGNISKITIWCLQHTGKIRL